MSFWDEVSGKLTRLLGDDFDELIFFVLVFFLLTGRNSSEIRSEAEDARSSSDTRLFFIVLAALLIIGSDVI